MWPRKSTAFTLCCSMSHAQSGKSGHKPQIMPNIQLRHWQAPHALNTTPRTGELDHVVRVATAGRLKAAQRAGGASHWSENWVVVSCVRRGSNRTRHMGYLLFKLASDFVNNMSGPPKFFGSADTPKVFGPEIRLCPLKFGRAKVSHRSVAPPASPAPLCDRSPRVYCNPHVLDCYRVHFVTSGAWRRVLKRREHWVSPFTCNVCSSRHILRVFLSTGY